VIFYNFIYLVGASAAAGNTLGGRRGVVSHAIDDAVLPPLKVGHRLSFHKTHKTCFLHLCVKLWYVCINWWCRGYRRIVVSASAADSPLSNSDKPSPFITWTNPKFPLYTQYTPPTRLNCRVESNSQLVHDAFGRTIHIFISPIMEIINNKLEWFNCLLPLQ